MNQIFFQNCFFFFIFFYFIILAEQNGFEETYFCKSILFFYFIVIQFFVMTNQPRTEWSLNHLEMLLNYQLTLSLIIIILSPIWLDLRMVDELYLHNRSLINSLESYVIMCI